MDKRFNKLIEMYIVAVDKYVKSELFIIDEGYKISLSAEEESIARLRAWAADSKRAFNAIVKELDQ